MHFCYLVVAVVIAFCQTTQVMAKHKDDNVVNVELDVPKIMNDILKIKGLKVSHNLEGGRMRAESDDYVLKIKFPHLGSIARMLLAVPSYNIGSSEEE